MLSISRFMLSGLLILTIAGCSQLKFPGVHKIDIQQGNIVTQEMVDQLKPGMTKSQVLFVMGTPLLADSFHQNRWDYIYTVKKPSSLDEREQLSILFNDEGLLSGLEGDFFPSSATQVSE